MLVRKMLANTRMWWNFRRCVTQSLRGADVSSPHDKDVVVLPCWQRPEFLWHCLTNLTQAEGVGTVHILFRPDTGSLPENIEVIRSFQHQLPTFEILPPTPCPFRRTKPSANLLLGCLYAARISRKFVFLVEEDIMVARDFFRWHRAVHATAARLFCSIAVKNPNRSVAVSDDTGEFYLSGGDYCSNGVCFDKDILGTIVAAHVNMAYLRSPKKYLRRQFPCSLIGLAYVEQDGLVRRIQEISPLPIAWPCVPRAFHSGFYGSNRPGALGGPLQNRIRTLTDTIYDAEAMRRLAGRPEFIETSLPCSLHVPAWSALRRVDIPS